MTAGGALLVAEEVLAAEWLKERGRVDAGQLGLRGEVYPSASKS